MHITQLTPDTARSTTLGWAAEQPPKFCALFSTVAQDCTAIYLGIFSDSELRCVVTLQPRAPGIYEVHLACKRGRSVAELLPAFLSIRAQLFSQLGVRELSGWVPRLHTGVRKLAQQVGFRESGAQLLSVVGGRLTEEVQVVMVHGQ